MKGTLIENFPESEQALCGRRICLFAVDLAVANNGVYEAYTFSRPAGPMTYVEFLTAHSLDYLLEVAFALGLILSGLYFAEWARKLFDVRRYRSALFLSLGGPRPVPCRKHV